MVNKCEFI